MANELENKISDLCVGFPIVLVTAILLRLMIMSFAYSDDIDMIEAVKRAKIFVSKAEIFLEEEGE